MRDSVKYVLVFLFAICISVVDFFGFSTALRHLSQDLFYAAVAPTLPNNDSDSPATVVLVGDNDIQVLDTNWPLPRSYLAELLYELGTHRPAVACPIGVVQQHC